MKTTFITLTLSLLAAATPVAVPADDNNVVISPDALKELEASQAQATGSTANEFVDGPCRDIIFIFARGSTEAGNLGTQVGPPTADGLKQAFGTNSVAAQGVDYPALLSTNTLPGGCNPADATTMRNLLVSAAQKCPSAKIVAGGYSQGAALTHRAIENIDATTKNRIVGVVTFGDTQNQQDGGRIPNYPTNKTLIICNDGDEVCNGTLIILAPHLAYGPRVPEAVNFYSSRIRAS